MKSSRKPRASAKPRKPGAGKGGNVPPAEHRFKNGPDPRRGKGDTARAILQNCINGLYRRNLRTATLRSIIRDNKKPDYIRQAAQIILHSRRATTIADFSDWIEGTKTLKQLAKAGVDVSVVKTASITEKGRRIELFDERGENFDRVMNNTGIAPSEQEKYKRLDAGQATERFDVVEFVVPGLTGGGKPS